ncbi:MAG: bifunctional 5,10-methylene-tetrahydrofolate dehydrogenase/5,10-methylene-tetrahydrofolate cyclohydrolase [Phycisphaerales bacterium]|nr:MAG: bifunctional 5,10-methylene-tetrahydrofolate dehydrogenase/5,10-methylene-tetrahydrofolate cyclohydrolase [Phycisphaerales bacterium]
MTTTHKARLMDGKTLAQQVLEGAAAKVARITQATGITPALATVLVGDDPASATYVKMKGKRCENAGMTSVKIEMPAETTTEELVAKITELGADPAINGILLQHPVPDQIDERAAFEAIPVEKDVDGVTAGTLGRVALDMPAYGSCTPAGIMRLLDEYQVELKGAEAVVVGRSPILGKPMAAMLLNRHTTVTVCHSRTRELNEVVRRADVVVAAVGRPRFVKGDWIKPGAVVIDAGYNEGNVGDVDFDAAVEVASLITPVPGGVGPMTLATLIDQTADAAAKQLGVTF